LKKFLKGEIVGKERDGKKDNMKKSTKTLKEKRKAKKDKKAKNK